MELKIFGALYDDDDDGIVFDDDMPLLLPLFVLCGDDGVPSAGGILLSLGEEDIVRVSERLTIRISSCGCDL